MRKSWIAVILPLLLPVPLLAQHANNSSVGNWATTHPSVVAMPPVNGTHSLAVPLTPLPVNHLPIPNYPHSQANAPVATAPATSGCCDGCQRELPKIDWQCFRDWLCYQPIKGGCPKHGSCGCNCSVPLYTYFLGTCKEGQKYELPPCVAEADSKPGFFRQMLQDGRSLFGSRESRSCGPRNCDGCTAYPSVGMMTGR